MVVLNKITEQVKEFKILGNFFLYFNFVFNDLELNLNAESLSSSRLSFTFVEGKKLIDRVQGEKCKGISCHDVDGGTRVRVRIGADERSLRVTYN